MLSKYLIILISLGFLTSVNTAEKSNHFFHEIINNNTTIEQISHLYFGTKDMTEKIIKWNHLNKKHKLRTGQIIVIKNPIHLPAKGAEIKETSKFNSWLKQSGLQAPIRYRVKHKDEVFDKSKITKIEEEFKIYDKKKKQNVNIFWSKTLSEKYFNWGEKLYHERNYKLALEYFKKANDKGYDSIPLKFYLLNIYKKLKINKLIQKTKNDILDNYPQLATLPVFKNYQP